MIRSVLLLLASAAAARADVPKDIQTLLLSDATTTVRRDASARLATVGTEAMLPLLKAWPKDDPVAANWIRTTFDDIATRAGSKLPSEALLGFVRDTQQHPKARRAALAALDRHNPGTASKLLTNLLSDPEFGPDAVADRMRAAEQSTDPVKQKAILSQAYTAATDVDQVQQLAKKLTTLGEKSDVARKLGLLTQWHVVGPFPVSPADGLKQSFPPETAVKLDAKYETSAGSLTWATLKADDDGKLDLVKAGLSPMKGSVAYAYAVVNLPRAAKVELRIGAVDNVTAWVNGKEVLKQASLYRSHFRVDRHRAVLELPAGSTPILLKLTKTPPEEGGRPGAPPKWDFQVRLTQLSGQAATFTQSEAK